MGAEGLSEAEVGEPSGRSAERGVYRGGGLGGSGPWSVGSKEVVSVSEIREIHCLE